MTYFGTLERRAAAVGLVICMGLADSGTAHALERNAQLSVSVTVLGSCAVTTQSSTPQVECRAALPPRMGSEKVTLQGVEGSLEVATLMF